MASVPDFVAALAFLDRLHPGRPRTLVVFKPRPTGDTVPEGHSDRAQAWIEHHNPESDAYVLLGICDGAPRGQPKKKQMLGSEWLWVDIDPSPGEDLAAARERIPRLLTTDLPKGVPAPTIVVDSGRGFWGLWQLAEPLLDSKRVERLNQGLTHAFGCADSCWNINRAGRLPGTINTKTGRLAKVLSDDPRLVYEPSDFPSSAVPAPAAPVPDGLVARRVEDMAELDEWGRARSNQDHYSAGQTSGRAQGGRQ